MSQHRIYSEEEATEVLKRAALLNERAQHGDAMYSPGITRSELQKMAQDMGISESFLTQAIEEASVRAPEPKGKWSLKKNYDHVFGSELHPDRFDVVSMCISQGMPSNTTTGIRQIGRSVGGSVMAGPNYFNIEVTSRGGRTRLRATTTPLLGYIFGPQLALIGSIMSGAAYESHGNMAISAVGIVASIAAGFGLFAAFKRWGENAADALIKKVTASIEEELDDQARTSPESH